LAQWLKQPQIIAETGNSGHGMAGVSNGKILQHHPILNQEPIQEPIINWLDWRDSIIKIIL
jgi:hypothetical protein